ARIREAFGVTLTLRQVFDHPTLAGLAERIDDDMRSPIRPAGTMTPDLCGVGDASQGAPLSFAQEGLWLLDRLLPASALFHLGYRFELHGPVDVDGLQFALTEVVRRHEALRTGFVMRDDRPATVVLPAGPITLHRAVLDPDTRDASR